MMIENPRSGLVWAIDTQMSLHRRRPAGRRIHRQRMIVETDARENRNAGGKGERVPEEVLVRWLLTQEIEGLSRVDTLRGEGRSS